MNNKIIKSSDDEIKSIRKKILKSDKLFYEFKNNINPNKKNILFISPLIEKCLHTFGFQFVISDYLKEKYNLIYCLSTIGSLKYINLNEDNIIIFRRTILERLKANGFRRKKEDPNYIKYNKEILTSNLDKCELLKLKYDKVFIMNNDPFMLTLGGHVPKQVNEKLFNAKNEYHDYIGENKNIIKKIEKYNNSIVNNIDEKCSILPFSTHIKNIFMNIILYIHNKSKINNIYSFVIDPVFYCPFFNINKLPISYFYFADDNRGTRNFKKFPIAELQHLVFENKENLNLTKTKNFIFAGSIFQQKNDRINKWKQYLSDIKDDNSSFFIPNKLNGIYSIEKSEKELNISNEKIKNTSKKFKRIYEEMISHDSYRGFLLPDKLNNEYIKYKYSLILSCISNNDSLNFRIINYLSMNILPFIDPDYDPSYLQIPKKFQNKLIVKSSNDIDKLIKYYNDNNDERIKLLEQLKKYYKINVFKKKYKQILNELLENF